MSVSGRTGEYSDFNFAHVCVKVNGGLPLGGRRVDAGDLPELGEVPLQHGLVVAALGDVGAPYGHLAGYLGLGGAAAS